MQHHPRLVPLIVACALFMENLDSTVIATSLPAIAADIGANPLALKLAVTSYLLSLAVFIPASGWTADRFGARRVFAAAIFVFMLGSIGCALASSLEGFVAARIVQGMGGAMMTPVGRLVLVRSIEKRDLVGAMAWVTIPALIGPVIGPPVGGFITTYASWHWIFLINIPIGMVGIVLVLLYIDPVPAEHQEPFDGVGMLLAGLGVAGLAFGLSVAGLDMLPWQIIVALVAGGAVSMTAYVFHAKKIPAPILDFSLLRYATFRASVVGGFMFRLGIGAIPFLLPLMLQTGFGMTPFQSGMVTFAGALGAIGMKTVAARTINRFGFRRVLDRECPDQFGAAGCDRHLPSRHAGLGADHDPAGRRLLPGAGIYRRQHHRLCRDRGAADEPGHRAGLGRTAIVDLRRCRRRRVDGRDVAQLAWGHQLHGSGFHSRIPGGRGNLGLVGDLVLEAAGRRRR